MKKMGKHKKFSVFSNQAGIVKARQKLFYELIQENFWKN
jgi:hypothetical protein